MSQENQANNIIAKIYDYIDDRKSDIFIIISGFVLVLHEIENFNLIDKAITNFSKLILLTYFLLLIIGVINKYRKKEDLIEKIIALKELFKYKFGNTIYYFLQITIKIINKALRFFGKKTIKSKRKITTIIKLVNKILRIFRIKDIKFNDFRIKNIERNTHQSWIDSGRKIFFISVFLLLITQLVSIIKGYLTFLDTSDNIENLLLILSLTGLHTSVIIIAWKFGTRHALTNDNIFSPILNTKKSNYKVRKISRPEGKGSMIIDTTKNHEKGYKEFLAKGKNKNSLVGKILQIIHEWNPQNAESEGDYRDRFEKRLRDNLDKSFEIIKEKKLAEKQSQGIADIIVNDVLIELKSDDSTNAKYRAHGQIISYARNWKKGPIILLLFDYNIKDAEDYNELMEDMWKNGQEVITVIAKKKKSG